jgi:hypothetical protein
MPMVLKKAKLNLAFFFGKSWMLILLAQGSCDGLKERRISPDAVAM